MSSTENLTIQFLGQVSRIDVHVLVDSVASQCYLISLCVNRFGLYVVKDPVTMVLRNGSRSELEGIINVYVKIQQYQFGVDCLVILLGDNSNLIWEMIG